MEWSVLKYWWAGALKSCLCCRILLMLSYVYHSIIINKLKNYEILVIFHLIEQTHVTEAVVYMDNDQKRKPKEKERKKERKKENI